MNTTNTEGAGTAHPDLRSAGARALDEMVEWFSRHLPDRIPRNADPLLLATPSWTSAQASELARRVANEFASKPAQTHAVDDMLRKLAAELLRFNPDASQLRTLRDGIDRTLTKLRTPPTFTPHPPHWLELATDLGIELPEDPQAAKQALGSAIASCDHGDRRFALVFQRFTDCVLYRTDVPPWTSMFRLILVGAGLPPVAAGSVFACPDKLYRPAPRPFARVTGSALPDDNWLRPFFDSLGVAIPPVPTKLDRQAERDIAETAKNIGAAAAERLRRDLERVHCAELRREKVVKALDKAIATMPISIGWWWTVEMRRHVAGDRDDQPHISSPSTVLAFFRSFNVRLDVA